MEREDDISVSSEVWKPRLMTKGESNIIIETLDEFKHIYIDYLKLLEILRDNGEIDYAEYRSMVRSYRRLLSEQQIRGGNCDHVQLVLEVLYRLSFEKVTFLMRQAGYEAFISVLVAKRSRGTIFQVRKRRLRFVSFTFNYYRAQKANLDNDVMLNSTDMLRQLIIQSQECMHDIRASLGTKQKAADMAVAQYVLLLLQYRDYDSRKEILDEMKMCIPHGGIDRTLVESIYNSKMAITEAMAGDHCRAIQYASMAHRECGSAEMSLASVLVAHDHQFVFTQCYARTQELNDLKEILKLGDIAIRGIPSDERDVQDQWKRLVLLYQAMSLLNITMTFEVKEPVQYLDLYFEKLCTILKEVRNSFEQVEVRRLMIYSICMARYSELKRDINAALTYQCKALSYAEDGGVYFDVEKENIQKYKDKLQQLYPMTRSSAEENFGETQLLYENQM